MDQRRAGTSVGGSNDTSNMNSNDGLSTVQVPVSLGTRLLEGRETIADLRELRALLSQPTPTAEQFDYTDIANRVQFQTGRSIWPRTVEAVLKVALSQPAPTAEAEGDHRG